MTVNYQAVDWNAIELKLTEWVATVTGLSVGTGIIWEDQDATQPPYPYVSLKRTKTSYEEGRDSTIARVEIDDTLSVLTEGPRTFRLTLHAHTARRANPNEDAVALLTNIQSSLGVQAILDLLDAAGIAFVDSAEVTDSSLSFNGEWISRANLDVDLRVASQIVESGADYFDKVGIATDPASDIDFAEFIIDGSSI